jgi:hypothetical protein
LKGETPSFEGKTFRFRARVYYTCGSSHFEKTIAEEIRAEIAEQWTELTTGVFSQQTGTTKHLHASAKEHSQSVPAEGAESRRKWKVEDRYCWFCGTHGSVFESLSRCSNCGELQRLYLRESTAVKA